MSASDLRSKILQAHDIPEETITVKAWDATLLIRGLTAKARANLLQNAVEGQGKNARVNLQKVYPDLVILTTFDPETNERVFQPTDRDALLEKAGGPVEQIAMVAGRLSGLGDDTQANLEKNSESTQSDASTSSSPQN